MTVNYNSDVSSSASIGFLKLLMRWKGSVWKAVYKELLVWLICYYIIFFIYRFALHDSQQKRFDKIAQSFDSELSYIPLTFMLGFFVNVIIDRWKQVINNIGYIENQALMIANVLRGDDPLSIMERRTVIRYLVLCQVLVFRNISMKVRKRFPNVESIVRGGFMTVAEKEEISAISLPFNKYWVPIQWAMVTIYKKMERDKIQPTLINSLFTDLKLFRTHMASLVNYDWVPIPLVYPQVVFLAVRVYFVVCLISRQYQMSDIAKGQNMVDKWMPVMTIIQFIFLVGWMKVAEALLNPLGEDDDDFECNFLIDKNIATGMAIVSRGYDRVPEMPTKDKFTDEYFKKPSKWNENSNMIKASLADVIVEEEESSLSEESTVTDPVTDEFIEVLATRDRAPTTLEAIRNRVNTIFSTSNESKEFDSNGNYTQRYFSQMSRY